MRLSCFLICSLAGSLSLQADVKMPAIFGDHMVLQQEAKIPVWGTAAPGEKVTVTAGDHTGSATAGADGKWRVDLEPFAPNTPPLTVMVAGKNTLKLDDVLIGEVWVASGQSNMEWSLGAAHDGAEEVPKANDPQLRLFYVGHTPSINPQTNLQGQWKLCTPDAAAPFSALAYFFGRELRTHFNRPVGIIDSCVGGTPARSWISLSGLEKEPPFTQDVDLAKSVKPGDPVEQDRHTPTVLYNGMIAPLMPYAIKGVIWYQGEDNAITTQLAVEYRTLFPRLITDWREKWGQGDFPFITMQLSSFTRDDIGGPGGVNWPILREAQAKTLSLAHTGIVATYDIGAGTDIHPKDKLDVGKRLALVARHVAYGEDLVYSGPVFGGMKVGGKVSPGLPASIVFSNTGGGLIIGSAPWTAPGLQPIPTTSLLGFTIAGPDHKFYPADAKITSADVVAVSSPQVSAPIAIRYYWDNLTQGNLYNKEGLPAFPFRTDDWDDIPSPSTP
jgi:sialate O-acetylesterase